MQSNQNESSPSITHADARYTTSTSSPMNIQRLVTMIQYKVQAPHLLGVLGLVVLGAIFILVASPGRQDQIGREGGVVVRPDTGMPERDFVDWVGVFSFVPNGIRRCQTLFDGKKYLIEPMDYEFAAFDKQVKQFENIEGNSALRIEQYLTYIKIVGAPFIRTVCETGFNAGHSTLAWLAANPKTQVYSFDLGMHDYGRPMAEYLMRRFPGRLNVTWGDSTQTLPEFHRRNPDVKCDLLIVDGGHTNPVCQSDFDVFRKMANKNNLVVLDNYPDTRLNWMEDLGDVWERAKRRGEMSEIFGCSYLPEDYHGFSIGRYIV